MNRISSAFQALHPKTPFGMICNGSQQSLLLSWFSFKYFQSYLILAFKDAPHYSAIRAFLNKKNIPFEEVDSRNYYPRNYTLPEKPVDQKLISNFIQEQILFLKCQEKNIDHVLIDKSQTDLLELGISRKAKGSGLEGLAVFQHHPILLPQNFQFPPDHFQPVQISLHAPFSSLNREELSKIADQYFIPNLLTTPDGNTNVDSYLEEFKNYQKQHDVLENSANEIIEKNCKYNVCSGSVVLNLNDWIQNEELFVLICRKLISWVQTYPSTLRIHKLKEIHKQFLTSFGKYEKKPKNISIGKVLLVPSKTNDSLTIHLQEQKYIPETHILPASEVKDSIYSLSISKDIRTSTNHENNDVLYLKKYSLITKFPLIKLFKYDRWWIHSEDPIKIRPISLSEYQKLKSIDNPYKLTPKQYLRIRKFMRNTLFSERLQIPVAVDQNEKIMAFPTLGLFFRKDLNILCVYQNPLPHIKQWVFVSSNK